MVLRVVSSANHTLLLIIFLRSHRVHSEGYIDVIKMVVNSWTDKVCYGGSCFFPRLMIKEILRLYTFLICQIKYMYCVIRRETN